LDGRLSFVVIANFICASFSAGELFLPLFTGGRRAVHDRKLPQAKPIGLAVESSYDAVAGLLSGDTSADAVHI
jgi:hypothetical protein